MKKILVYHQNEVTRDELRDILSIYFQVIVVHAKDQCLAALAQKTPIDLAFIGIHPDEDNDDLVATARQQRPAMTIIAMGSTNYEAATVDAVRLGANGYVLTPLRAEEILAIARK